MRMRNSFTRTSVIHTIATRSMAESRKRAREVLQKHADRLVKTYHATALGVGHRKKDGVEQREGEVCLVVWVKEKLPESQVPPDKLLPKEIDGVELDVRQGEVVFT